VGYSVSGLPSPCLVLTNGSRPREIKEDGPLKKRTRTREWLCESFLYPELVMSIRISNPSPPVEHAFARVSHRCNATRRIRRMCPRHSSKWNLCTFLVSAVFVKFLENAGHLRPYEMNTFQPIEVALENNVYLVDRISERTSRQICHLTVPDKINKPLNLFCRDQGGCRLTLVDPDSALRL
jgi:hypothetical protein